MKQYRGYKVVIEEYEDGEFLIKVPDLPGCVTATDVYSDIEWMVKECVELWLEAARDLGWEIPAPK